jgi:chorismate synthase
VALGAIARAFLDQTIGVKILSHVLSIGSATVPEDSPLPNSDDRERIDSDPVRCFDSATSEAMILEINDAHSSGDTLGGVIEVLAYDLPPGLGSHTHWDKRLDARLAGAVMGIQAIKGVEIGDGFTTAKSSWICRSTTMIELDSQGKVVRRTDR